MPVTGCRADTSHVALQHVEPAGDVSSALSGKTCHVTSLSLPHLQELQSAEAAFARLKQQHQLSLERMQAMREELEAAW